MQKKIILFIILFIFLFPALFFIFQYFSKAAPIKANILIDTQKVAGKFPDRWRAFAQGGEEKGARMLQPAIPYLANLYPKYIRLDHIYDFYDVVSRDNRGQLQFNWESLDKTVCDIYNVGAKPFFSLGYMPPSLSEDGSLISKPKNWNEWSMVVQKTIEHYSGKSARFCGQISGFWTTNLYYEVWNEPDLESFGKWSLYGGEKDYKTLYKYSVIGAQNASDVNDFKIGGPATTALYQNWIQVILDYITENNLRIDFLSWHHYSKNPSDFTEDIANLNQWLSQPNYSKYRSLPKIISEWGYDSEPNPIADTNLGATYTITAIRNFVDAAYEQAFLFEVKDGPTPRWGIFNYDGSPKIRYHALTMLNELSGSRLWLDGEGTYVTGLATMENNKIIVVLTNFDPDNKNVEMVPVTFINLKNGNYILTTQYLDSGQSSITLPVNNSQLIRNVIMKPNSIVKITLVILK